MHLSSNIETQTTALPHLHFITCLRLLTRNASLRDYLRPALPRARPSSGLCDVGSLTTDERIFRVRFRGESSLGATGWTVGMTADGC